MCRPAWDGRQRTSVQYVPRVAVLYDLQQRARHDGSVPLGEITPAPPGRHVKLKTIDVIGIEDPD